ncbi:MAG: ABC transporter permease subunit [Desulfurococcaceae archaeon]
MKLEPVIYDLKRGLLRPAVLIILVLFISSGVGLAYLVHSMLLVNPAPIINHLVLVKADFSRSHLEIEGVVYTPPYNPIRGEIEYKLTCSSTVLPMKPAAESPEASTEETEKVYASSRFSFNGEFKHTESLSGTPASNEVCQLTYSLITPFIVATYTRSLNLVSLGGDQMVAYGFAGFTIANATGYIKVNEYTGIAVSVSVAVSAFYEENGVYRCVGGVVTPLERGIVMDAYVAPVHRDEHGLHIGNPVRIGTVKEGLFTLEFKADEVGDSEHAFHLILNATVNSKPVSIEMLIPSPRGTGASRDPRQLAVAGLLLGAGGIGLFEFFFPVVMLYLVYVYIAKPRSTGALEFVLARPVTRFDIYATRFASGALVALLASGVFHASLMLSINLIFGVSFDYTVYTLLYLGTAASLVAFYSLCYFIASTTRGVRYLAFSIFAFLFFTIIVNILQAILVVLITPGLPPREITREITVLQYRLKYFNPLGVSDFAKYFVQKHLGIITGPEPLENIVLPELVALSTVLWITIPLLAGWIIFRKANLAG